MPQIAKTPAENQGEYDAGRVWLQLTRNGGSTPSRSQAAPSSRTGCWVVDTPMATKAKAQVALQILARAS